jgi:hypothetical protein
LNFIGNRVLLTCYRLSYCYACRKTNHARGIDGAYCWFGAVYDNLPGDFQAKKTLIRDFNPAGSASGNAQIVLFLATFPVKHPSKP